MKKTMRESIDEKIHFPQNIVAKINSDMEFKEAAKDGITLEIFKRFMSKQIVNMGVEGFWREGEGTEGLFLSNVNLKKQ